ncbi:unnamed protein product [Calicophoron daubneyi]|uniref:CWH43-like N-terminal domain-containing protein n=1 Tax=Calicophoron daubneyi TaxID=300641 RepID=A0AAV2TZB7_CALDB
MRTRSLKYLPIWFGTAMIGCFAITYAMSTSANDVSILFPYISDTGTLVPESCVFAQLLNICACLGGLCGYCWYGHQVYRIETLDCTKPHSKFARLTLGFGFVAALGISIVANFQETTVNVVHLIGALMTFGFGTVYCACVSHASRVYLGAPRWLWILRSILSFIDAVCFVITIAFIYLAGVTHHPPEKWDPDEPGYLFHSISVSCEWFMAACFIAFFFTMIYELRDYTLDSVKVRRRGLSQEEEVYQVEI